MLVQPPSGGCVLKPILKRFLVEPNLAAAFGRLCVETAVTDLFFYFAWQPPSGGCVLKLIGAFLAQKQIAAAAFGRLCVETWRKEDFSHLN